MANDELNPSRLKMHEVEPATPAKLAEMEPATSNTHGKIPEIPATARREAAFAIAGAHVRRAAETTGKVVGNTLLGAYLGGTAGLWSVRDELVNSDPTPQQNHVMKSGGDAAHRVSEELVAKRKTIMIGGAEKGASDGGAALGLLSLAKAAAAARKRQKREKNNATGFVDLLSRRDDTPRDR